MSDDDYEPYRWQVGDPPDWGDSVGVPDIPYMGYINDDDDDYRKPPSGKSQTTDEILAKEAWSLQDEGRYEEALTLINRALELNSNNFNNWNIKAIILDNWGKNEEALIYYDKSLELNNSATVRGNKAQCLYRIAYRHVLVSEPDEKDLDIINEALKLLPDDNGRNKYIRLKGGILQALGEELQAKKCFLLASGMLDAISELEEKVKYIKTTTDTLINITGTRHYNTIGKLNEGQHVTLIKEPDNEHDSDAIRVESQGDTVGYVANSPYTLLEGVTSASQLKNEFENQATAEVMFRYLDRHVIAKLIK